MNISIVSTLRAKRMATIARVWFLDFKLVFRRGLLE